jgi:acyl-CoA synthetase (AMP-forming)/AMP-acid ligase II
MACDINNVAAFLLDGQDPSRFALQMIDQAHTYGDLQSASSNVAKYLADTGAQKGDRALLVGDNSLFWVAAYLGILRAGLVCVPVPTTTSAEDLDYIVHATEVRFAFVQARFALANRDRLKQIQLIIDRDVPALSNAVSFPKLRTESIHHSDDLADVQPDDLAALMFTSGSTGKPRGVMVSHGNIIANTESIVQYLRLTENDRIMTVLPFHYCFGTSLLHTHLRVGATLVIDLRFMYPEKVLERILATECTGFAGVPSHFQILLRKSSLRKKQFPQLRYVQQAGGHLAPSFVHELRGALPDTQIFIMYGQTEATARLSYLPSEYLDKKLGSIGKAIPGVTLQVLDDLGGEVAPGQIGEIVAQGANVTQGYWREPNESAKCFRDGKLYSGDMGTVDEEGFIYVVDRAKDFLKCAGKRVSCRQLEETLLEFDELLEAAVIGMKDDILGEAVKAFIVPRDSHVAGLELRVLGFCKEHLAHQLVPKEIVVMNSLPKNSSGKVLKQKLKNPESEASGRSIKCESSLGCSIRLV